jgi:hypothetical protein
LKSHHPVAERSGTRATWIGWGALVLAVVASLPITIRWPANSAWATANFDDAGRLPELLVRLALLVLAVGARPLSSSLGVLTFAAGLTFRALGVLAFPAAALSLARGESDAPRAATAGLLAVMALFVHLTGFDRVRTPPRPPRDLPAQVAYFSERDNPLRARAAAASWCAREKPSGLGCLVLAEAELALGRPEDAVRRARGILTNPDQRVRDRAAAWLSRHGATP